MIVMRSLRFCAVFCLFCLCLTGAAFYLYSRALTPGFAEVTVLQTTDVHGARNFARFGPVIDGERKRDPELLLIDCGDLTQGTLETSLDGGLHMVDALNAFRYDVWIPGNHEFDYGAGIFARNARRFSGRVLAANLRFEGCPFREWKMFRRHGLKIAVIGCIPPFLKLWIAAPQLAGVETESPEAMLERVMPEVRAAKPDIIVLAIHLGEFSAGRLHEDGKPRNLGALLARFPEIALVLGGHTHESVAGKRLPSGAWFVQAPFAGKGLMKVTVRYNLGKKRVKNITSEILPPAENRTETMPGSWNEINALADRERQEIIAELPDSLAIGPVRNPSTDCPMARLCAKAIRTASGADAGFSMTYSKYEQTGGVLTGDTLFRLIPYENFITVLTLDAEELKRIRTEQLNLKQPHNYLFEDGIRFELSSGGRQALRVFRADGREITGGERITAAFGSYAVSGAGGRYPVLKSIAESGKVNRRDTELTVRGAFRDLIGKEYGPKP